MREETRKQSKAMDVMLCKTVNGMEMKDAIRRLKREIDDALRIESIHADIVAENFESMKGMAEAATRYRILERGCDDVADLVGNYLDDLADDVDEKAEELEVDFLIGLKQAIRDEHEDTFRDQMFQTYDGEDDLEKTVKEGAEAVIQIAISISETAIERALREFCDNCIELSRAQNQL